MTSLTNAELIEVAGNIASAFGTYRSGASQLMNCGLLIRRRLTEEPALTNEEASAWLAKAADILLRGGDALAEAVNLGERSNELAYRAHRLVNELQPLAEKLAGDLALSHSMTQEAQAIARQAWAEADALRAAAVAKKPATRRVGRK